MTKILVIKTECFGTAPYYGEFYAETFRLSGGIPARSGWHEEPKVIFSYEKKPYKKKYLSERDLQYYLSDKNYVVEII